MNARKMPRQLQKQATTAVARVGERRPAIRPLSSGESLRMAGKLANVLGWFCIPLNAEGKPILGAAPAWVKKTSEMEVTYQRLAQFAFKDGAAWPEYKTLGQACGVGWRQAIRRGHAVRSIGLAVTEPVKRADGSPSSNNWGLVDPERPLNAMAVCVRLERPDPEGNWYQIKPLVKGLELDHIPPFPTVREPKPMPVWHDVQRVAATCEDAGANFGALPPWWATNILRQEGIVTLSLQAHAWGILQRLQSHGLVRDKRRPGKCLRGIARNLQSEALGNQVIEELLATGQSLTAEQELRARRGRLIEAAYRAILTNRSNVPQWLMETSELAGVRRVTELQIEEIQEAISQAQRLLGQEVERRSQLQEEPYPDEAKKWVTQGVSVVRGRRAKNGLATDLLTIAEDLWSNRMYNGAPDCLTRSMLDGIIEGIRLQE